ncbi:hypothetical protein Tco_0161937 [Tanacetum coccineum]
MNCYYREMVYLIHGNCTIWRLPPPILKTGYRQSLEYDDNGALYREKYALIREVNEAIPEVNPVVPEPNQVVDIHDPNEMVDIPDDIDLVDYDDEDPEEDHEEEPEEDVEIELDNDAEGQRLKLSPRLTLAPESDVCIRMPTVGTSYQKPYNKMFYLDMVRIGAVPKPPSDDEDTEHPRNKSKNSTSDGTEGPSEPRGPP